MYILFEQNKAVEEFFTSSAFFYYFKVNQLKAILRSILLHKC